MARQLGWRFSTCPTGQNLVPRVDDLTGLDNRQNRDKITKFDLEKNETIRGIKTDEVNAKKTQIDPPPGNVRSCKSLRSIVQTRRELAIEEHTTHAMSNCHSTPAPITNTDRYFVSGAMSIACEHPGEGSPP